MTDDWGISYEIGLRWMLLDLTDDKSTLVQVMAWCRQATSHYLSQCWPRSLSPYGVTKPQWVNSCNAKLILKQHDNIFVFSGISQHWDGEGSQNPVPWKTTLWNAYWLISRITQCICWIFHNVSFCNKNMCTFAHICYKMVHFGIWDWGIVGFVYCLTSSQQGHYDFWIS